MARRSQKCTPGLSSSPPWHPSPWVSWALPSLLPATCASSRPAGPPLRSLAPLWSSPSSLVPGKTRDPAACPYSPSKSPRDPGHPLIAQHPSPSHSACRPGMHGAFYWCRTPGNAIRLPLRLSDGPSCAPLHSMFCKEARDNARKDLAGNAGRARRQHAGKEMRQHQLPHHAGRKFMA
jgi:hypothetical protein